MNRASRSSRIAAAALVAVVLALGAAQFTLLWNTMPSPDGIAYFEVADQIAQLGYAKALPLHWAPLYPLALVAARGASSTGIADELVLSAAADAIALVTLCLVAAFAFRSIARICWPQSDAIGGAWVSYAAGMAVFVAFGMLRVGLRMPDVLVTSLAVTTLWAWCHGFARRLDWRWALLAGIVGGVTFLARANLLHWSAAVAALACAIAPRAGGKRRVLACASFAVGLLAVVGPHTYLLSSERGQLTWGETGKIAFVVGYGAEWPNGVSAWPERIADGDVRIFTDRRTVNFPGFYEPGREFEDAAVLFAFRKTVSTMARAATWCLMGNQSPSFAWMWPLFWAAWPLLLFRLEIGALPDDAALRRRRIAALLVLAGAAGLGMHLVTFCNGYYLPPYLIALSAGGCLAMLDSATATDARDRRRAAQIAGVGFVVAAVLLTARYARSSEGRLREGNLADARAMAAALSALPRGDGSLRKIAVAGNWLGLYGVRLSDSQVLADIPDPEVIRNPVRFKKALRALRDQGVVALLVSTTVAAGAPGVNAVQIGAGHWSLVDLSRDGGGGLDETSRS